MGETDAKYGALSQVDLIGGLKAPGVTNVFTPLAADFSLNRPFVFAIKTTDNLPLFVGIVNQP